MNENALICDFIIAHRLLQCNAGLSYRLSFYRHFPESKKTADESICGQEFPREVIKAAMRKVDQICLENAIEQMKQTDNIRNYEKYLISTLFNEANGRSFRENAEDRSIEYVVKRDFGY